MTRGHGRAVSDVVAFTLVFSTIIFMIGVVTVTGIGTLGDVQQGTESNVAEETMRNYASTLADHRTESATRRSVTVKLQGHGLALEDAGPTLGWSFDNGSRNNITTGALVRETDTGTELVYESGALFRVRDGNGLVVRQPPMRCGDNTAHLAVTKIRGNFSISSDTRVTLQSELDTDNQSITPREGDNATVSVSVYTNGRETADLWGGALSGAWQPGPGPNEYVCRGTDRLVVHETTVRIDIVN